MRWQGNRAGENVMRKRRPQGNKSDPGQTEREREREREIKQCGVCWKEMESVSFFSPSCIDACRPGATMWRLLITVIRDTHPFQVSQWETRAHALSSALTNKHIHCSLCATCTWCAQGNNGQHMSSTHARAQTHTLAEMTMPSRCAALCCHS